MSAEDKEAEYKPMDTYSLSKAEDQILSLIEYIERGGDVEDLPASPVLRMRQQAGE